MSATSQKSRRKICSYDMAQVPESYYLLSEAGGEMFFCNPRCLFLWAGMFVTKATSDKLMENSSTAMKMPDGRTRRFGSLLLVAQWAAANALHGHDNPWYCNGEEP